MMRWILPSVIVVALISAGLAVWLNIPFWPALLIAVGAIALKAGSRV